MRVKADIEAPRQQHSGNSYSGFPHEILEAIFAGAASTPALEGLPPGAGLSPPGHPRLSLG